jgi:exonuclease SbcC
LIPVRLQLKNFMSYGDAVPPLELAGVRMACLSGDNGNGKSALLDAMTWALFGETRAAAEDDLIRIGSDDCAVLLDFEVGTEKYRVKRQRGKRAGAIWELQIWQADGSLRSLSGTNARETKARIEHLLRMDYRTFLASGYLAQGRADEFARATVTERKKVLADILDLSRYERLEEMAKERHKEAGARELDVERELNAIDRELENEDRYHLALEEAQRRLLEIGAEITAAGKEYEDALSQIQGLETEERRALDLEERVREARDECARTERTIAEICARITSAEAIVARRPAIEAATARAADAAQRIAELQPQFDRMLLLEREARTLETTIRDEHTRLDRERYKAQCDVETLEGESRDVNLYDTELSDIDAAIAGYGAPGTAQSPDARRRDAEAKRAETDDGMVALKGEHGAVRAQIDALEKRIGALAGSDASLCEYCGQPLPPGRRAAALSEARAEQERLAARLEQIVAAGREAKRQSDRLRQDAERAQADLAAVGKLEARRAQAIQERYRLSERTKTLPDVRRHLERATRQLTDKDFLHAEQERQVRIAAELERLERVAQDLQAARAEHESLAGTERDRLLLQQAEEALSTEPARVEEGRALVARRTGQIEQAQHRIAEIRTRTAGLTALRATQKLASARLTRAQEAARDTERQVGHFAGKLEHCAKLKEERARWREQRQAAARDRDLYRELVAAFGKKGVQALIIETALPEIEEHANDLLSRMTDNAMHLRLLTQREAKSKSARDSGGAIETLDIVISDDAGTRPYEMYSGGEAFRINFALRVALSRLLARRAGAPLQTLILDEGFGTQDPRGREALVGAINAITDDFQLILVITHIEELKEAFQTRIEVVKGPDGSTFTMQ